MPRARGGGRRGRGQSARDLRAKARGESPEILNEVPF